MDVLCRGSVIGKAIGEPKPLELLHVSNGQSNSGSNAPPSMGGGGGGGGQGYGCK